MFLCLGKGLTESCALVSKHGREFRQNENLTPQSAQVKVDEAKGNFAMQSKLLYTRIKRTNRLGNDCFGNSFRMWGEHET